MPNSDSWTTVLSLADEQWGLLTKQQVEASGVAWSTLARQVRIGTLERVAHGVYRVRGSGDSQFLELRAAWMQLNPALPVWERGPADGIVSHRSACSLYGIGHLPADVHEFTLPIRRQSRRTDLRLHRGIVRPTQSTTLHGLPVTRPHRIAADLLADHEDPGAVAQVIADALRLTADRSATIAASIAPSAAAHGFRRGDGEGLLRWLLNLSGAHERDAWISEAGGAA